MSHPDSLTMVGDSCASCGRNRRFHEGMGGFTGTGYCSLVSVVCKEPIRPGVFMADADAFLAVFHWRWTARQARKGMIRGVR